MNSITLEQSNTEQSKMIEELQKRNPFFGIGVDFDPIERLIQETKRREKLEELRVDIGDELFNQLSDEDKNFIIETEGIIDLGYEVSEKDLKRMFKYIEEYED